MKGHSSFVARCGWPHWFSFGRVSSAEPNGPISTWEAAEWRFTVTKTETSHLVPLSRQAIEILREIYPLTGQGRFVFPSARTPRGNRPMSENAVLAALRRMGVGKEEMTGHGFRAMARTLLDEELGFRPDYIEHQLAHVVRDPLGRAYNRTTHLPERRR